jgi:hypothetical protein
MGSWDRHVAWPVGPWPNCLVVSNMAGLLSIIYLGCHPSHWLSYFSRWLLHHQAAKTGKGLEGVWWKENSLEFDKHTHTQVLFVVWSPH